MPPLWFILSIAAASCQACRNGASKAAALRLQPLSVSFVRFAFGLPWALIYLVILAASGYSLGRVEMLSVGFLLALVVLQLTANTLLVSLFSSRSLFSSIGLYKLDTLFSTLLGTTLFGQMVGGYGWLCVVASLGGVWILTARKVPSRRVSADEHQRSREARFTSSSPELRGVLAALCISGACFASRFATTSIDGGDLIMNSGCILASALALQSVALFFLLWWRSPREFSLIGEQWREDSLIGLYSTLGSICWFLAFNLAAVGLVSAVGQFEMVLTLLIGRVRFGERLERRELIGVGLITVGTILGSLG